MKAGPKPQASTRALVEGDLPRAGGERACAWMSKFLRAPKGTGAREPLRIRPWQRTLLGSWFDEPRPRLGVVIMGRGNGKSTLSAGAALYAAHGDGVEAARAVMVASDERQARLDFAACVRMTETSPWLAKRSVIYADRIVIPRTGSEVVVLPSEPARLEGLDPSFAIVDEAGVVPTATWDVLALASGKRDRSLTVAIGTPGPDRDSSPLWALRQSALDRPDDPSITLTEFSAHPGAASDDETAWAAANPGLDDLLHRDAIRATLPPRTAEAAFRRARLAVWPDGAGSWLPYGAWDACADRRPIPDGTRVVLAFDGSFSGDATALVAVSVEPSPHLDLIGLWEPPGDDEEYRVPTADVEDAIRRACRRFRVVEIACDPYRWTRTMQALEAERLPVVEFPQSPARMTPATEALRSAIVNRTVTHSGNLDLARHVANAVVREDARGTRLAKERRGSRRRIDAAVCAVMGHARASYHLRAPRRGGRMLVVA